MEKRICTREELKLEEAKHSYYLEVFIIFGLLVVMFG